MAEAATAEATEGDRLDPPAHGLIAGSRILGEDERRDPRGRSFRAASFAGLFALSVVGLTAAGVATAASVPTARPPSTRYPVAMRVLRLVDATRTIRLPDGRRVPRSIVTDIFYPARPASPGEAGARPPLGGPYPLIVFGHGFRVTPDVYSRLLRSWAAAGYVVAAPVFPLENANAPGGPDERDIVNQPADMSFVITRLLHDDKSVGPLRGVIDPKRIAVAGHSDGGETALAVAYARGYRDPRVRAAVLLSGANSGGLQLEFSHPEVALLVTQGTADTLNRPRETEAFFDAAPRPKFLLTLYGATHLAPYTNEEPQLRVVEQATRAFLDHILKGLPLRPLLEAADVPGVAALTADP